jgi:hypothetical protein
MSAPISAVVSSPDALPPSSSPEHENIRKAIAAAPAEAMILLLILPGTIISAP